MVIADGSVELRLLALDLCAQAEHGDDGLIVAASPDQAVLDELERLVAELAAERPTVAADAPLAVVAAPSLEAAVELADELAPEHLELACERAEELSAAVQFAGCVLVGRDAATAFGDSAAGSNHVLPTGGAGRFQGPLGPSTFRRRLATVRITEEGARDLAPVVATLADSEGFPVHGESARARTEER
jgi:histidinol dehydrogenase